MQSVLFEVNGHAILLSEFLAAVALAALFFLLLIVVLVMRGQSARQREAMARSIRAAELEMQISRMMQAQSEQAGRISELGISAQARESELARTLNERLDQVTQRLGQSVETSTRKTSDSLSALQERLAVIDAAQKNITELSGQVVSLQDILSDKQARGAFGQGRMETIIADGLPSDSYEFQATLSNGKRPDCLIRLPNTSRAIVVDAKFPLEAFSALQEAHEAASIREAAARIRTDMGKHINDISSKYLLPGETQDMAIMFVPSESIYATLYESFEGIIQKAYRARIIIVSPNMLMLAVHTMQAVLKDARMREQAHLIQIEVVRLMQDVHRLKTRVFNLEKHFAQANADIDQILISADKISNRGRKIENVELAEDGEETIPADNTGPKLVAGE
jgi:DNA recombination protein RmuC